MLLMRPDAAQRVTVFGSTRNRAATSPGVSSRSLLPSILTPPALPQEPVLSVATRTVFIPSFRKIWLGNPKLSPTGPGAGAAGSGAAEPGGPLPLPQRAPVIPLQRAGVILPQRATLPQRAGVILPQRAGVILRRGRAWRRLGRARPRRPGQTLIPEPLTAIPPR